MPDESLARSQRDNRFARHPLRTGAALLFFAFLGVEALARGLVAAQLIEYIPFRTTPAPAFWVDDDPHFGVWHPPHAEFRDRRGCFDVTYRTNSAGARDRERSRHSTDARRVIVLGDSFVEGIGVETDARVTDRLEQATGVEHLNFGTAGNFGSIQAWLLYESLARDFDHNEVLLFVLPDNDFDDNDPSESSPTRYRPYLREAADGFELYYTVEFAERDRHELSASKLRKNRIFNASYFLNALRHASHHWREELREARGAVDLPGYNDFTPADLRVFIASIERLLAAMGPERTLTLVLIPRSDEFQWVDAGGEPLLLPQVLESFAAAHPRVQIADLLPGFLQYAADTGTEWDDFFLPCDGHWSALGHEVAAEILLRESAAGTR